MNLNTAKTVREVALEVPAATRVFEQLGIDYCCGGNKSLEEACGAANLEIQRLLNSVESAATAAGRRREGSNWQAGPLADLIAHISNTHHKYTREEIARLSPLLEEVVSVHREQHRELLGVCENFHALAREITTHMMKEETVRFPYIERLEEAMIEREPVLPPPFGTVQNSVATNDARALRRWKPGVQHMQSAACERLRELPCTRRLRSSPFPRNLYLTQAFIGGARSFMRFSPLQAEIASQNLRSLWEICAVDTAGEILRMLHSIGSGVQPAEALPHAGFNSIRKSILAGAWYHLVRVALGFPAWSH